MITETTNKDKMEKPDIRVKNAWRVIRAIAFIIILLIAIGVAVTFTFISQQEHVPDFFLAAVYALCGAAVLWRLLALILYPIIEYRQWFYMILEDRVEIRHGIFFIKNSIIPIIRIQHVTVEQGPVYRHFGLFNVVISLASGTFQIVGLRKEKAEEITGNLNRRLYGRLKAAEEENLPGISQVSEEEKQL